MGHPHDRAATSDASGEAEARAAHARQIVTAAATFHVQGGERAFQLCCAIPDNLTREHAVPQRRGIVVRVCRRCGRRHFRLLAEPGVAGMRRP